VQTPVVCDGLPVQPGSGRGVHPQVRAAHSMQRMPVAQDTAKKPLLHWQPFVTHVLLATQLVLLPQATGFVPQPDGTDIAQG
jgi:hypothetical protein